MGLFGRNNDTNRQTHINRAADAANNSLGNPNANIDAITEALAAGVSIFGIDAEANRRLGK